MSMPPRHHTTIIAKCLSSLALLFFCVLMLRAVLQDILMNTDPSFLEAKHGSPHIRAWLIAFYVNVFSIMFALVAGATQFSQHLRTRHAAVHRWMGRAYVFNVLLISAPTGLIVSLYSNGDEHPRTTFTLLSCLWWYFTYTAYWSEIHRDVTGHRNFMVRSFALTLSLITLHLWNMGLSYYFQLSPMNLHGLATWLGCVPNLIVAEWWIRRKPNSSNQTSSSR